MTEHENQGAMTETPPLDPDEEPVEEPGTDDDEEAGGDLGEGAE
ncbi:MAG TPA: hypothetical protein VE523_06865 [Solirubrobacterales bacterium]|jgi:hypothetical protein|nr:hypothetical protein [Solirubrobacterales bacterium]